MECHTQIRATSKKSTGGEMAPLQEVIVFCELLMDTPQTARQFLQVGLFAEVTLIFHALLQALKHTAHRQYAALRHNCPTAVKGGYNERKQREACWHAQCNVRSASHLSTHVHPYILL